MTVSVHVLLPEYQNILCQFHTRSKELIFCSNGYHLRLNPLFQVGLESIHLWNILNTDDVAKLCSEVWFQ